MSDTADRPPAEAGALEPFAADLELARIAAHPGALGPRESAPSLRLGAAAPWVGIWELDPVTGLLTASPLVRDVLDLAADAPLTWQDLEDAVHPDDRQHRRFALDHCLRTGADFDSEHRVRRADGAIVWLHLRAKLERGPDGAPRRLAGIFLDVTDRRAAEIRLQLSEESLRLAADAAEVGTWDLDLTTDKLTWSDRTKAMFGISPGVPCSMADFYAGLHPDDFAATRAAFASAIDPAVRATYDVEYRTIGREDGVIRWVAAKGRGLFQDDGGGGGVCHRAIGTAIDITARKQAEIRQAFLLDLLDRLRKLTEPAAILQEAVGALGRHLGAARVGFGHVQPDDRTVELDTGHADGVAPLHGAFLLERFGGDVIERNRRGLTVSVADVVAERCGDLGVWAEIETRAFVSVPLVRDGRLRATLFVNHRAPHGWSPGDVTLIEDVAGRLWDALERARAQQALRELNSALERQVETRTRERDRIWHLAPVLMAIGDAKGVLLAVNPAWTRVLGWTEAQSVGRDVMEFVAPEDRQAGAAGMQLLAQGRAVNDYQISFATSTGGRRRIAWTTVPEAGRLHGYGRDVTDQVLAEEQLRQAQKMEAVGQLTSGLAHDFNNLLTGITGSLELLQVRASQGRVQDLDRYIGLAQGAAQRAASLVQRLLAFSRRQTLDPQPTDINALVRGMEEMMRRAIGPGQELRIIEGEALGTTLVDPHQLESALLNLCINARDAMDEGGVVTICTGHQEFDAAQARERDLPAGSYVTLTVSDTGAGMSPEVLRRAFDPFFTTKKPGEGTGLGLSMVYGFVKQSGGHVCLRSTPGRGTSVRMKLPRHGGTG
jgi:PAS domain S-box-containing protein